MNVKINYLKIPKKLLEYFSANRKRVADICIKCGSKFYWGKGGDKFISMEANNKKHICIPKVKHYTKAEIAEYNKQQKEAQ